MSCFELGKDLRPFNPLARRRLLRCAQKGRDDAGGPTIAVHITVSQRGPVIHARLPGTGRRFAAREISPCRRSLQGHLGGGGAPQPWRCGAGQRFKAVSYRLLLRSDQVTHGPDKAPERAPVTSARLRPVTDNPPASSRASWGKRTAVRSLSRQVRLVPPRHGPICLIQAAKSIVWVGRHHFDRFN
jgi:hypothetical protein